MAAENASVNDFTGKTVVVTGASSGIGLAAAQAFARGGARLAIVGRDESRLEQALSLVRAAGTGPGPVDATAFRADFTILDDVRSLATRLGETYPSIDVLANNAGGTFPNRTTTVDGYEQTIQTNHLAPFLLTHLLLDHLQGGRVINTASDAHRVGQLDPANLNSDGRYRTFQVYGASKQANILFTAEAARRWPDVDSYSYHPGVVRTRFGRDSGLVATFYRIAPFLLTAEQGADTMVWLASAPTSELVSGGYYVKRKRREPNARTSSAQLAEALWAASETAVGLAHP